MEIDMYKNRIAHLEELHRILDKDITTFEKENPYHNSNSIQFMIECIENLKKFTKNRLLLFYGKTEKMAG